MNNTLCFSKRAALTALRLINHEFAGCEHASSVARRLLGLIEIGYFDDLSTTRLELDRSNPRRD